MQRTMNGAFADTAAGDVCGEETVKRSVRSMIAANGVMYREMLSNVSASRKSVLYAMAQEKTVANPMAGDFVKRHSLRSASSVQSALTGLMRSGLIVRTGEGYSLADPLLRIFINSLYSTPEV